ncbi:hypothetical protein FLJC2902T_02080 [Flavobacterium limnosediminis JC2902]|uniref:DUF423 domain-containing protein n=1 Tax=Flavobacterium limnosediminis JC2902 TaxID=1341181 RepID=V6STF5_9FLAO|nr:DUF423 domain-containing protein [Flavobacterium limnosediminis]ESU29734.1 hypothetical protein FLJC2902T_02080 [Flavobacterium limnosediminis JC2902]
MDKKVIAVAAFMGAVAIVLGAFGAHSLKAHLGETELATFETGVRYQMYHALFLLFVGTTNLISVKTKKNILWLVSAGVVFFSGSIYLLSTASITLMNTKIIGPITPLGGLLMISGWIVLFAKIRGGKAE